MHQLCGIDGRLRGILLGLDAIEVNLDYPLDWTLAMMHSMTYYWYIKVVDITPLLLTTSHDIDFLQLKLSRLL